MSNFILKMTKVPKDADGSSLKQGEFYIHIHDEGIYYYLGVYEGKELIFDSCLGQYHLSKELSTRMKRIQNIKEYIITKHDEFNWIKQKLSELEKKASAQSQPKCINDKDEDRLLAMMPDGIWNNEPDVIHLDGPGGSYPNPRKIPPDMNSSAQSQAK